MRSQTGLNRGGARTAKRGPRKPKLLPKTLTRAEAAALLAAPNVATPTGLRDRCVMELMYRCGLRVSEACGLHVRDVKWDSGRITVRAAVAKGGVERTVYAEPATVELLERWKAIRRRYGAGKRELFVVVREGRIGEPLTSEMVYRMVRRRGVRAGIERDPGVHPHMLRHTFASELAEEGKDLAAIQALLGHANIATTSIYLHVANPRLAEMMRSRDRSHLG